MEVEGGWTATRSSEHKDKWVNKRVNVHTNSGYPSLTSWARNKSITFPRLLTDGTMLRKVLVAIINH